MHVVAQIRKVSKDGRLLEHLNYNCAVAVEDVPNVNVVKILGPQGFLCASHTVFLENGPPDGQEVFYKHDRRAQITPGTIVPLYITLWPIGMVFAPGEGIVLRVSGHDMAYPETEILGLRGPSGGNVGEHWIHSGQKYDSHVTLPTFCIDRCFILGV